MESSLIKLLMFILISMSVCSVANASEYTDIDKQAHFFAGYAIESTVYDMTENRVYSMSAACGAGVAKELYDKRDYGLFDEKDAIATCVGGIFGGYLNVIILEW